MIAFIEDQRIVYGVESICRVLPIAPSTYYHRLSCLVDPSKASDRSIVELVRGMEKGQRNALLEALCSSLTSAS